MSCTNVLTLQSYKKPIDFSREAFPFFSDFPCMHYWRFEIPFQAEQLVPTSIGEDMPESGDGNYNNRFARLSSVLSYFFAVNTQRARRNLKYAGISKKILSLYVYGRWWTVGELLL